MKRLFAAIKIHPTKVFTAQYLSLKKSLADEKIRWVNPDNIHITLKFFGETAEHHISNIADALRAAADTVPAFTLDLKNTGIFGSSYNPRVIWFGIDAGNELQLLSENVFLELEKIGIEHDRQNFVPHLTIARIKYLKDKKHFQQIIDQHKEGFIQKEEVNEFHLFESILRPQGPLYNVIKSFPLGN
ncbi:MAG: RNA 2',3'-cyclic phosphodiesterase [Bacteroidetes bacterium]|nr:RNA 2',3'-cyclic phosphodiesterase [Bacteroidota bacterium]